MTRTAIAFIVAPLAGPAILAPLFTDGGSWRSIVGTVFIGTVFCYLGTAALGIPLYRYMRANGWVAVWHAVGAGIIGAAILWMVFMVLLASALGTDFSRAVDAAVSSFGKENSLWRLCLAGTAYGLVFWLIARPDRAAEVGRSN